MSKAYVIVTLMICMSFTGCLEFDDSADDKSSSSLEEAFNDFIDSINTKNWRKYCSYILYTVEDNEIILANNTELDECEAENDREFEGFSALRLTISNYIEEKLDYRAANNSGFVYSVDFTVEECVKEDDDEDWDCDDPNDESILWVEVGDPVSSGQWVWWDQSSLEGESAPIASFSVAYSNGIYHVDVIAISMDENLTGFNFYLKDDTGSTYVDGSNGFGKIALQNMSGVLYGIDTYYDGDDDGLKDRATNISNDNGTVWPVHFSDNDRDGTLSAGDQFMVYGNGANGPASDNWRLEIQFAATGDIVGSARMT